MTDDPCTECGEIHRPTAGGRPCIGHANVKDEDGRIVGKRACARQAMTGLDVCYVHGGAAKHAKAAGERRDTEAKAEAIMRRFGEPVDTTPTEALLDTVKWTAGHVAWLRGKVAGAVDDDDLTQYSKVTGKAEPSVWADLLGQWQDRLVRVCKDAITAGIEERRVRIAEQQGALVADVIRKILDRLELSPEQATRAGEVVPVELRRLAGPAA